MGGRDQYKVAGMSKKTSFISLWYPFWAPPSRYEKGLAYTHMVVNLHQHQLT